MNQRIGHLAGEILNALTENGMVTGLTPDVDDPMPRYREVHKIIAGTIQEITEDRAARRFGAY